MSQDCEATHRAPSKPAQSDSLPAQCADWCIPWSKFSLSLSWWSWFFKIILIIDYLDYSVFRDDYDYRRHQNNCDYLSFQDYRDDCGDQNYGYNHDDCGYQNYCCYRARVVIIIFAVIMVIVMLALVLVVTIIANHISCGGEDGWIDVDSYVGKCAVNTWIYAVSALEKILLHTQTIWGQLHKHSGLPPHRHLETQDMVAKTAREGPTLNNL